MVKMITIVFGIGVLVLASVGRADFYDDVARYHAPVIYQEVGGLPRADQITRFDYDGDFRAENNWNNLGKFSQPAYVYSSLTETETHFFILYALYHVRDYKIFSGHENDLEGVLIVVEKDGSPHGTPVFVEALAHDKIISNGAPVLVTLGHVPQPHGRVALYVEPKGHGIHSWANADEFKLWVKNYSQNNLIYYFGDRAEDPAGKGKGEYAYALLSIKSEFWDRVTAAESGGMFRNFFNYQGQRFAIKNIPAELRGGSHPIGTARPPWGWTNKLDEVLVRGEWFFDPAYAVSRHYATTRKYSLRYLYHPYGVLK